MRVAGYFHEIDDWCPAESYPLHIRRLNAIEVEDRLRDGFVCTRAFESRAVILGWPPAEVVAPRPIEDGDELVLMRDWGGTRSSTERFWWLVTRCP